MKKRKHGMQKKKKDKQIGIKKEKKTETVREKTEEKNLDRHDTSTGNEIGKNWNGCSVQIPKK